MGERLARRVHDYDSFPGWARFPDLVASMIEPRADFAALDIGGGAHPMVAPELAARISYTLLDIDPGELAKASTVYDRRICADATMPTDRFTAIVGASAYDLVFSHMFPEHVQDPAMVHRNIFATLKPGGRAVHAFPLPNNLPLAANYALPEAASRKIVRLVQPGRDLEGGGGKFPAYYRGCFSPGPRARRWFESFGWEVERHDGFAGHLYYDRVPGLSTLERLGRRIAVATQIPWICFGLVVLRKPVAARQ